MRFYVKMQPMYYKLKIRVPIDLDSTPQFAELPSLLCINVKLSVRAKLGLV